MSNTDAGDFVVPLKEILKHSEGSSASSVSTARASQKQARMSGKNENDAIHQTKKEGFASRKGRFSMVNMETEDELFACGPRKYWKGLISCLLDHKEFVLHMPKLIQSHYIINQAK